MAWKETPRSQATMIRRRFRCDDCQGLFDDRVSSRDAPYPDCPACVETRMAGANLPVVAWVPPLPSLGTTKGRAIDLAQEIAEKDFGLTNFNDNQRIGDIAFKPDAPMQTAEREALVRQMVEAGIPDHMPVEQVQQVENYWQGNQGSASTAETIGAPQVAKEASAAARDLGADPVGLLEKGRASGNMPLKLNIMGSCTKEDALTAAGG